MSVTATAQRLILGAAGRIALGSDAPRGRRRRADDDPSSRPRRTHSPSRSDHQPNPLGGRALGYRTSVWSSAASEPAATPAEEPNRGSGTTHPGTYTSSTMSLSEPAKMIDVERQKYLTPITTPLTTPYSCVYQPLRARLSRQQRRNRGLHTSEAGLENQQTTPIRRTRSLDPTA